MTVEQLGGLLFSLILIRTIQFMHADDMRLIVEDVSAVVHDIRSINGTIMPGDGPLKSNQAIVICGGAARASGQLAATDFYSLLSVQVCSPHWHLNMRTIPPVWVLSIFAAKIGWRPH
ncbi:hypothetical protein IVB16_21585 [Bradyrhizobium sp. 183]|uniref:hypothetical protein n=1 Tax=unclassified Bradyrhizobium TaxID=2631580 RepID=UPI001FFEF6BF|nr:MULTISPECIES: hypothetical protein [unclassified Bradyrhizobium]UPJ77519.1 hypothetical protein IVB17_21580 [Bradyrhizobium sp. 184]UPJ85313.1 hypothetical protein IVB16_21585 [Bradyrhizobium sp. 183]